MDEKYLEEPRNVITSYIDDDGYTRSTKATDRTKWGKGAEFYDDRVGDYGSYLDSHEKDASRNKQTKMSDSTRWGKGAEVYDDSIANKTGESYLLKQQQFEQERLRKEREMKEEAIRKLKEKNGAILDPETNIFPYSELKDKFPKGVDPARKEMYLSDEEFFEVFGMDYEEFEKLSAFKKKTLKKKVGLF
jgi:hypothetical protein